MKKIITVLLLFISSSLLANSSHGWKYRGVGKWQKKDGKSGRYHLTVKGHYKNHALNIMQTYMTGEKNWHFDYSVIKEEHGFFKVMKEDAQIGEGYCTYSRRKRAKNCHYSYTYGSMTVETSLHMKGRSLYRMGSVKGNGQWITFKEKLSRHR